MARNPSAVLVVLGALLTVTGCVSARPATAPADILPAPSDSLAAAEAALAKGRYEQAVARYRRALEADPDHVAARLGLAEALLRKGDPGESAEIFDGLLGVADVRPAALQGKGLALLAAGDGTGAEDLLRAAVEEDSSLWRAWNALGRHYDRHGRWEEAAGAYGRALDVAPEPAVVHNNLGVSLMAQSRYGEAATQFLRALELKPGLKAAKSNLRLSLAFQGRYAEALADVEGDELPRVLNNIGYAALLRGDRERAEAYFVRALEASPSFFAPAWQNLQAVRRVSETNSEHVTAN